MLPPGASVWACIRYKCSDFHIQRKGRRWNRWYNVQLSRIWGGGGDINGRNEQTNVAIGLFLIDQDPHEVAILTENRRVQSVLWTLPPSCDSALHLNTKVSFCWQSHLQHICQLLMCSAAKNSSTLFLPLPKAWQLSLFGNVCHGKEKQRKNTVNNEKNTGGGSCLRWMDKTKKKFFRQTEFSFSNSACCFHMRDRRNGFPMDFELNFFRLSMFRFPVPPCKNIFALFSSFYVSRSWTQWERKLNRAKECLLLNEAVFNIKYEYIQLTVFPMWPFRAWLYSRALGLVSSVSCRGMFVSSTPSNRKVTSYFMVGAPAKGK